MSGIEPRKLWWSAEELAASGLPELPGTKRGINALADQLRWRNAPGCTRKKQGRGGGWLYHWSVLPLAARHVLLKDAAEPEPERQKKRLDRGEAWSVFDGLPEATKTVAATRLKTIQLVETLYGTGLSHVQAVDASARQEGVSARTIYNWLEMIEGVADEDRLAYLAPRNRTAKRQKIKATCSPEFLDHLKGLYLRLEKPTFKQCYRLAVKMAQKKGWETLAERTALRRIESDVPRITRVFAREGEVGLMRCFPAQIRDRSMMTAMEGVNADCHKIDVFVRWPDGTVNRPQIVGFQDIYSGKILSWRVDHDPNKVMVMAAFGEMVENYGIPKHCLFDNGHEFANKWMTAGSPTRFRFKVREDDPLGVLPLLDIKVHWAQPAHGQAKPIERAFRDLASDIAKDPRFSGAYVGNKPDAKPENYGSRAISADTFLTVLAEGIEEHNARDGRLSHTAQGRSFDTTFTESYESAPIRKATEEQRRLWLMGQHIGQLNRKNGQLQIHGNHYHSEWMSEAAGQKVVARFNPEDLHAGVFVYDTNGGFMGFAECRQKVGFFDLAGAKDEARRRRRIKKAEKALLEAHRPVSIEDIAEGMAPELPAQQELEAKVVAPVFGKRAGPSPMRPVYESIEDAELDAEQNALILSIESQAQDVASPEVTNTFIPSEDPDVRFEQALEIKRRSDAGEEIGREEASWFTSYTSTPEYETHLSMHEHFDLGGAGKGRA